VLVTFADSPKMSTYLLFFGLGDFERKTVRAGAAEVGVITKRGDLPKAQYGLDAAAQILPWYNDYFGTAYPLPKMDNIAAPGTSQFFSAMENWGAIFYFENAMLYDPAISTESDKQRIFTVFAHEMAHQWFGDLVTMAWWDDLWLNEGFASWMEGRATEHFHPEWNPELDAVGGRNGAMNQDALVTTHPVVQHVKTVEESSQAFDAITYQKGEAVIRMLEAYTGSTQWRDGVRAYMKRYANSNTVTDDLWREIEKASGKPIVQIAHDFTLQPGIPLIRVAGSCSGGATKLDLTQGEFTRDRPDKAALSWNVPVIASGAGGAPVQTLVKGTGTLSVPGCGPVIVNAGQSGYYRTLYAPAMFQAIAKNFAQVKPVDQLGIMSDAAALGLVGLQPLSDSLDLAEGIPADAQPQVIESAGGLFTSLYFYSQGNADRQARLRKFAAAKFGPVLQRLGWVPVQGESDNLAILRNTMIQLLGTVGDPATVAEANRRFAASASDPAALAPSLRRSVIGVVAQNADAATWERLHQLAKAENNALIKSQLYMALGASRDPKLAQRALDLAISSEPAATDSPNIISRVAYEFPDLTYDWVLAHYDAVMAKVDTSSQTRYIARLASSSSDPAMVGKLEAYKAKLPPAAARPTDEAIAAIKYRIQVREKRMPAVDSWLQSHSY
jgi:aminopeptidase N